MTERATRRPDHVRKPEHWRNPPVPEPQPPEPGIEKGGLSPTRYGDWELKGIAVDF